MQVRKQQLEPHKGQRTGSNLGKQCKKLYTVTLFIKLICRVHHVKRQAGWVISWNQDCWGKYQQPEQCSWYHSNGRKWRGTKYLPDEGERAEWTKEKKTGLKLNIQNTKFMASSPITSWQIEGGRGMEAMTDFIFLGSKITVDCDCRHEIKRYLLLGRKAMTILVY